MGIATSITAALPFGILNATGLRSTNCHRHNHKGGVGARRYFPQPDDPAEASTLTRRCATGPSLSLCIKSLAAYTQRAQSAINSVALLACHRLK